MTAPSWRFRMSTSSRGVLGERGEVAERVVEVAPVAADRRAPAPASRSGTPRACPGRTCGRSRRAARCRRPATSASAPPSATGGASAAARRELDVGLAEQRLLAQDRARVGGQRRVLGVELDHHDRAPGALVGLDRLHLADRHAGDPHVGLGRELGRLGERRGDRGSPSASAGRRRRTPATGTAAGRSTTARTRPSRRSGRSWGRPCSSAARSRSLRGARADLGASSARSAGRRACRAPGWCCATLSSSCAVLQRDARRGRGGSGRARPASRTPWRRCGSPTRARTGSPPRRRPAGCRRACSAAR